ncbi:hypothetical protein KUTeg_024143 [Tegillarca granosa]|uniref:Polypeptide N-acetylgalactosaminyltransferase n=1 Tax=Tegillarca granosa TaxID=220873 RepID=A0ABQ9E227_TEGGR|nr:hypothetical protein KUTeg_024143 [Tegillarca granosa]
MRRNSITILKYLIFIGFFSFIGHLTIQYSYKENSDRLQINDLDYKSPEVTTIEMEQQKTGPGEHGKSIRLSPEDVAEKRRQLQSEPFSPYVSDMISLHRSLPDNRHPDCRKKKYLSKLPNVSVIIPFHNEYLSILMRTVWSILDRSPPGLVHEVILVDDFSKYCKEPLDSYVKKHFTNVRILRGTERLGLIRARILGARNATGEVLLFLDCHCEANVNWLPPLLEPIAEDYKTVVCPFIDVIDRETYNYRAQDEGMRGAFDWHFDYKRLPITEEDRKHPSEPFKSPVMAGGLFAISTKWFWELGGYDEGLEIWGGEQYELSFKIWQCGGMMVDAPCSRIGHIYGRHSPFDHDGKGNFVDKNYKRVAVVWMDEYAEYLYKRRPKCRTVDPGDVSEQKKIREKLNCKPFSWFMKEVAFDLQNYYPAVEPTPLASGKIINEDFTHREKAGRFTLQPCNDKISLQKFEYTFRKDIRLATKHVNCFDVSHSQDEALTLFGCHGQGGYQEFIYSLSTKTIFHPSTNHCLDYDSESLELFMKPCDKNISSQKWKFDNIDEAEIKKILNKEQ